MNCARLFRRPNLPAMQVINLGYNPLSVTIPTLSWAQLPLLNFHEIDDNYFGESIADLSSTTALTAFFAGHNCDAGTLFIDGLEY
jgi:hypothetical protein